MYVKNLFSEEDMKLLQVGSTTIGMYFVLGNVRVFGLVRIMDLEQKRHLFKVIIPSKEISLLVRRLAREIVLDVNFSEPLICIGVLKGSFVFMADLIREMDIPIEVDFVEIKSYEGISSTGKPILIKDITIDIHDRHVLIIEDIVDSGVTLTYLLQHLLVYNPKSIKVCSLLVKHMAPLKLIDYYGTLVENFVVGYGLDFDELHRNLSDICLL